MCIILLIHFKELHEYGKKNIDINSNKYLRQSYKLTKSSSNLTSAESNLVYIILSQISKDDTDFKEYEFSLTDLSKIMSKEINYSRLKATAISLCSKPLMIEDSDIKDEFEIINWFSHFKYSKGVITCVIDSKLKDYLLEIDSSRFSLVSLKYILLLKGKYSKKLYTLLMSEKFRTHFTIDIDELCSILKVPNTLCVFSQFNRAILKQAQKDMQKFSNITFDFETIKRARKVKSLKITIKDNKNNLEVFIKNMRELYVNTPLLMIDNLTLQVSEKGYLYYLEDIDKNINKKRAFELWQKLHDEQKNLLCFGKIETEEEMEDRVKKSL